MKQFSQNYNLFQKIVKSPGAVNSKKNLKQFFDWHFTTTEWNATYPTDNHQ